MKIVHIETLISAGEFPNSHEWSEIHSGLLQAIELVDWPPGSRTFTIHPERKGNGVKPIKNECITHLKSLGWLDEEPMNVATNLQPGDLDAVYYSTAGAVAMEWETGNVSSSHRALNKMAIGLMKGLLVGASLVIPSRNLYRFLTDRIGNYPEISPYLDLWRAIPCANGVLEIIVIEQDAESVDVPKIPKGTDGRAKS